jgi:hypothetical protein
MMGQFSGNPIKFDGKNPWVFPVDFPNKTNPMRLFAPNLRQLIHMESDDSHWVQVAIPTLRGHVMRKHQESTLVAGPTD